MFDSAKLSLSDEPDRATPTVTMGSVGRLYLTRKQAASAARIAGQTRWLWNHFVALNRDTYASTGRFVFYKEMNASLSGLRKTEPRLADGLHRPLQMAIMSLDRALKECAKSRGSNQKGFPRFRAKSARRDGFQLAGADIKPHHVERDASGAVIALRLPKLGRVRVRGLRLPLGARQWRFTIRETAPRPNGESLWSISVNYDAAAPVYAAAVAGPIGLDVGLTRLGTLSSGEIIPALRQRPKLLKRQRRLNRERDRRRKGSVNRRRTVVRLARLHAKAANIRENHLHQASRRLVKIHAGIALEKLSAKGLMQTRMAGSMSDAGLAEMRRQICYKASWARRSIYEHPTFSRSTGVCPDCDLVGDKLPLSIREWTCTGCGAVHDRDAAAAKVVLRSAMEAWDARASRTPTVGGAPAEPPRAYEGKRAFAVSRGPGTPVPGSGGGSAANVISSGKAGTPKGGSALFGG